MKNVCRLCLSEDDLVWIFDKRFENNDNMKDVIYITTGVEVTLKDVISQNICKKCCQVTIKMLEFRKSALKNDQILKEKFKVLLYKQEIKIPNTQVTIRAEPKQENVIEIVDIEIKEKAENEAVKEGHDKTKMKVHPTVQKLFEIFPQIKIPMGSLKYDINPRVSMPIDEVEEYFKVHKLDIKEHIKLAMRSTAVASKRTTQVKPKTSSSKSKSCINATTVERKEIPEVDIENTVIKVSTEPKNIVQNNSNIPILESSSNKRKFDDTENPESNKSNFVESLGLTANIATTSESENPINVDVLPYITNKSVELHICEICNSVQDSLKNLKRHQYVHMRCQFCKIRLTSIEHRKQHQQNECRLKNAMNNLPWVKLKKIEQNIWVRRKYQDAFTDFPPLKIAKLDGASDHETNVNDVSKGVYPTKPNAEHQNFSPVPVENQELSPTNDVIEILSDEEDIEKNVPPQQETQLTTQTIALCETAVTNNTSPNVIPQTQFLEKIVYNTVSIVKPDIRIKDCHALDVVDGRLSDIKFLKNLFVHYKPIQLEADRGAQTMRPTNDAIKLKPEESKAVLKYLKHELFVYKIPVVLKKGEFDVSFSYIKESKPSRKLCLWNDLKAIDLEIPAVNTTPPVPDGSDGTQGTANSSSVAKKIETVCDETIPNGITHFSTAPNETDTVITTEVVNKEPVVPNPSFFIPIHSGNTGLRKSNFNLILQDPQASTSTQVVLPLTNGESVTISSASSTSSGSTMGSIRVKNVWELT